MMNYYFLKTPFLSAHSDSSAVQTSHLQVNPSISKVCDKINGSYKTIKLGFVMEILGENLQFDPNDKTQGVFAITKNREIKFKHILENKPNRLIVLLDPAIQEGDFTLELRTKIDCLKNRQCNALKKAVYNKSLKAVR